MEISVKDKGEGVITVTVLQRCICLRISSNDINADTSGQATFYGGRKFTVLIWPVFSSKGFSTPDV